MFGWDDKPACPRLDASWSQRQRCRKIKGCFFSVFQHTPSCQIESKSNTIQRKATPQSYQSIIWCNNGRQVYVGSTSIIHAFISKACKGEMNRSFYFFCFISPLGGQKSCPSLPHTLCSHTNTQHAPWSLGLRPYIDLQEAQPSQEMSPLCSPTNENECNADNRRRVNCCTAFSFGGIIKDRRWQWWWLNTLGPNQVRCIIPDALETVCVSAQHLAGIVFQ